MIEKSIRLACGIDEAFARFCERAGEWWPVERRHTGDPRSTIVIDPAGPFYEHAADGRQVPLGVVREHAPPHRLVLDWYPGTGPDLPTRVEVRFEADGDGTRVHRAARAGDAGEDTYRQRAAAYERSWTLCCRRCRRIGRLTRRDRPPERLACW